MISLHAIRHWLRDHGFYEHTVNDAAYDNQIGNGNIHRYGRWYLTKYVDGGGDGWGVKIAWHVAPRRQLSASLEVASNDGYDGIMWHIGTPLVRLWFEVTGDATRRLCEQILPGYWAERKEPLWVPDGTYVRSEKYPKRIPGRDMYKVIEPREIKAYIDGGHYHYSIWGDPMGSDGLLYGGGFIDNLIFGKRRHRIKKDGSPVHAIAAFPEGNYEVILQRQTQQWKYSRFGRRHETLKSTQISLKWDEGGAMKGPMFRGKGENSWDCGDDMIISMASEGHDLAHAVASYVEAVLRSRKRYGHVEPRDRAIDKEAVLA